MFRADPAAVTTANDGQQLQEGDTGLFSNAFNAFELYNIYEEINAGLNDLFAFLNLGLRKTAIATSDTHKWYSSEAGIPRSFVHVGSQSDSVSTLDDATFSKSMVDGTLVGTNGPWMELEVLDAAQQWVGLGALADTGPAVKARVKLAMPNWVHVDTLDLFWNTPDVATTAKPNNNYPAVQKRIRLTENDFTHSSHAITATVEIELTLSEDAWLVAVVQDDKEFGTNKDMFPVVVHKEELPFAYTNAIFLDVNRNGKFDSPGVQGKVVAGGPGGIPLAPPVLAAERQQANDAQRLEFILKALQSHKH